MKKILQTFILLFTAMSFYAVELKNNFYYIEPEDCYYFKVSDNKVTINESKVQDYKFYYDEYGYLNVKLNNELYTLIDGVSEYLLLQENTLFEDLVKTPDGNDLFIPDGYLNGFDLKNVKASSYLKDKYHSYIPQGICRAFATGDTWWCWVKNNIPWVEGKTDDGIGEYIEFDVERWGNSKKLVILNGYVNPQKKNLYKENNRIKTAEVICDNKDSYTVNFNDCVEFTEVQLNKEYKHVKIVIKDVYKGSKYSDTCLTAVLTK